MLTLATGIVANIAFYLQLLGWGYLVTNLKGARKPDAHPGSLAIIGTAFLICAGGFFTFWSMSPKSLYVIAIIGLLGAAGYMTQAADLAVLKKIPLTVWFVLAIIVVRVGFSTAGALNAHDDYHGYLVLPQKIQQTGTLAPDFFNERRMGVLGGAAYLQSLYLCFLPLDSITGLDKGVGILLIAGAVLSILPNVIFERKGALILLMCALLDFNSANVTFIYISAALLSLLASEVLSRDDTDISCFQIAIISTGLIAIKNYFIVPVLALLCLYLLKSLYARRISGAYKTVATLFLTLALLSPWLFLSLKSCGTLLFPLTGTGNHGSSYGLLEIANNAHLPMAKYAGYFWKFITMPESLVCCLGLLQLRHCGKNREAIFAWLGVAALLSTAWLIVYKSMFLFRYAESIAGVGALLTILWCFKNGKLRHVAACILILFALKSGRIAGNYKSWCDLQDRRTSFATMQTSMLKMQAAIPSKAPMAIFASHPFLLDFSRNPVHVFDHYGGASPPPGLPPNNEALLKKYLLAQGIRYLAFSYGDHANYGRNRYSSRLLSDGSPYGERVRRLALLNFNFQDMILSLGRSEKIVFDDGSNLVIDLSG
ncbi:hypothetical protein [Geomonas anaerohicana]|uniref:Glycosyltransferase RgtA/B/C/D-like domain-containing protein n=1 Tax=Geomonas anaerohicana TaxID=2798583 RepID=A0ABS0YGL9_9BACT|nr:hypothetical protein [Geomonas anaerohicana]MBJ6751464.1 hypothetical protein [Geomonas anaerohicana]